MEAATPAEMTHDLLFVGGLHRSGTSLLYRILNTHPDVSCFSDTGVSEDEGQHLQDVYPTAAEYSGVGRFGFYPHARLTETSQLVTDENRDRLWASWSPHWNLERRVLAEKSPPNVIRSRFLQALFPEARFLFILRHPIPTTLSTMKWSHLSITATVEHWLTCHGYLFEDLRFLRRYVVIRYEDLIYDRHACAAQVSELLEIDNRFDLRGIKAGANEFYFQQWERLRRPRSRRRQKLASGLNWIVFGEKIRAIEYSRAIEAVQVRFEEAINRFGYSFFDPAPRGDLAGLAHS